MGIRACPAAELVFDGAEVPAANRLGEEGEGYQIALSALGEGRISIAAACVGLARAALEPAAAYLAAAEGVRRRRWPSSRACGSCSPRWPARSPPRGR